jgi:hypothetical protein
VFVFPFFQSSLGLRGTLILTAGVSVAGALLTLVLPEPAGRSLEEISGADDVVAAAEQVVAAAARTTATAPAAPANREDGARIS